MLKRALCIAVAAALLLGMLGCAGSLAEKTEPERITADEAPPIEVSYAEPSFAEQSESTDTGAGVLSDAEQQHMCNMLKYLAAFQHTQPEQETPYTVSFENMLGFVWAMAHDGKYEQISPADPEQPDIYSGSLMNEKILMPVFGRNLGTASEFNVQINGWEPITAYSYKFVTPNQAADKSVTLGDIILEETTEDQEGIVTARAVVANGFWQSDQTPLMKITAQLSKSTDSPFGFSLEQAVITSIRGFRMAISSVEASSSFSAEGNSVPPPDNLFDSNIRTVWTETATGSGVKEYIKFSPLYNDDYTGVSAIGIVNGNMSDFIYIGEDVGEETGMVISNSFDQSARVRRIRITTSDGYTTCRELPDYNIPTVKPYIILFDKPVRSQWIKLSIEAIDEPTPQDREVTGVSLSEIIPYRSFDLISGRPEPSTQQ